jgi:molybdopterin converting factor subunit 1
MFLIYLTGRSNVKSRMPRSRLLAMVVNLLYFASFRDLAGRNEESVELPDGTRVRDLWERVTRSLPRLSGYPAMPPAAVNHEYVDGDHVLRDGDEVAFLPPVAGG